MATKLPALLSLALAAGLLAGAPAIAQPAASAPTAAPTPGSPVFKGKPGAIPSVVEYGDTRYVVDPVGLSLPIPLDCTLAQEKVGDQSRASIFAPDKSWLVIVSSQSVDADTSLIAAAEALRDQWRDSSGLIFEETEKNGQSVAGKVLGVKGRVIEDVRDLVLKDKPPGVRFYVSSLAKATEPSMVHGYTLFKIGADQFLSFELRVVESDFPRARAYYENMIAAADIADPLDVAAGRLAWLEAGAHVLETVDETLLRTLIAERPERWLRLYVPGPTGASTDATEVGYQRVRCMVGQRGMLDPDKSRDSWRAEDREDGFLVQLDGRALDDGRKYDWRSVMFLSLDRTREGWVTRNAVRKIGGSDREVKTTSELGIREGDHITVSFTDAGGVHSSARPLIRTDLQTNSYVSRVEAFLLPQILIRSKIPAEFAFYSYNPDKRDVVTRRDSLTQPSDKPGAWMLSTRLTEDRDPQSACFNDAGQMIWTKVPQGDRTVVCEPIEFEALVRLWRSKGLPLD